MSGSRWLEKLPYGQDERDARKLLDKLTGMTAREAAAEKLIEGDAACRRRIEGDFPHGSGCDRGRRHAALRIG